MRGGRFEQKKINVRNAEALLESRSVAEVRQVEAATRKEIEDKKEELRQLVGASYRDLIDSADSIVIMAKCCDCIMANLAGMSQGLDSIRIDGSSCSSIISSSDSSRRKEELYGIGSRVKYLVDTPEKIWGCLDEHMYLEGAERYLRARQVHTLLLFDNTSATSTHFPLLRHQWPLLDAFHTQISARARERLQDTGLSADDYAVALAAIAIVESLSSSQLFSLFLDTRKAWLKNYLRAAAAAGDSNATILCKVVDMIQLTLCHIGQLFLDGLLFTTILTAPPSSQLFGGISNPEKEVAAWKIHREKLDGSMVPLSGEFLAQASLSFLALCAQELSVEIQPVLARVSTGKELAQLERCLRLHIDEQAVLQDSLEWLNNAFGRVIDSPPWEFLSMLLLKTSLNLWETLFEGMFVRRVKDIVDSHINGISILDLVDKHLESVGTFAGFFHKPWIGLVRSLLREGDDKSRFPVKNREWLGEISLYFGPEVCQLQEAVDEGLKTILQDFLMSLGNPRSSSRISQLAPFLHDRVISCMSGISKALQERLQGLSRCLKQGESSSESLVNIERALFLGRLSLSLGEYLRYLPIILGPPERWTIDDDSETGSKDNGHFQYRRNCWSDHQGIWSPRTNEASQRLKNLKVVLGGQWDLAHELWVSWSTDMLKQIFIRDLTTEDSFSATAFSKGWEETVLKQDPAEAEIKISLPAAASPSAVGLLFMANEEIYRVGGHILDRKIIHSFASRLLEKVLGAYERFLANNLRMISERGSLQLLFDVRFLANVLVGLQEDLDKKQAQSEVKVKTLLSTLYSNLDPIDWATYEPHLWENEQRSYQRCAVLFGFVTQLNRLYTEFGGVKNQPGADANTMSLINSVPRFTSLPISMPVLDGHTQMINAKKLASKERDDDNFTFDDREGSSTSLLNAPPLFKSLIGQVGSRIGEGSLKFEVGRLRDKSAAAISTFGDMLPALSSLDGWN